ncbi:hypothetical protein [Kribbella deserti]|uniref:DUF3040 domain-containing protein n=1 Tax=Kribbella deserti TaxID=1926257 RepID=A0ABV6QJC0_9ACTN
MISENEEIARLRIEERIQQAEARAALHESSPGPRHQAASLLRRWADRLEPQPRVRRPALSR